MEVRRSSPNGVQSVHEAYDVGENDADELNDEDEQNDEQQPHKQQLQGAYDVMALMVWPRLSPVMMDQKSMFQAMQVFPA